MAIQGEVPVQQVVRGDTLSSRDFTILVNGSPPTISSATFGVKHGSVVIYGPVSCVVASNVVTRPAIAESITSDWGKQSYTWDIRCTIDGVSRTWIKGSFAMLRSEQEA